jgi:hypothetical protein
MGAGISFQGFPARVGAGLQTNLNQDGFGAPALAAILSATDHGGVTVHLESSNPSILRLSTDGLGPGTPAIDVVLQPGESVVGFWIEGMAGALGTVTITASASGFSDATTAVDVVQPRVQLIGLSGLTTVFSPETPFGVAVGLVNQVFGTLVLQGVRVATDFTITNAAETVARLRTSSTNGQIATVTIPADGYTSAFDVASGGVAFVPVAQGSTAVTANRAGFDGFFASIPMIVSMPTVTMHGLPLTVGAGLQTNVNPVCCAIGAGLQGSNHGGVTVRIASSNPDVARISPNETTPGTEFIDVFVPAGQTSVSFYAQGVAGAAGEVLFTATAPGFQPSAGTVTVVQPAVQIVSLTPTMGATDPSVAFQVAVGLPATDGSALAAEQLVPAGASLTVTLSNSNASVAQLVTLDGGDQSRTITIPAGHSRSTLTIAEGGVEFDALTAGSTTVSAMIENFQTTTAGSVAVEVTGELESRPIANAGVDRFVNPGALVTLNGSGSSDPDGDPLIYAWSLVLRPSGSSATLAGSTTIGPSFVADAIGTYRLQLIVNDGVQNSDPDLVEVRANGPPIANAGPDRVVPRGSLVALDGSLSTDPDGSALTYHWTLHSRPSGSSAALSNPNIFNPTFSADRPGTYVAQLVVNDGMVNSASDAVQITTQNEAPVANAGSDQIDVPAGSPVMLDGRLSSDPDGDTLAYSWEFVARPTGSVAVLSGASTATPTFTIDRVGLYRIRLALSDPFVTAADSVDVTTVAPPPGQQASAQVAGVSYYNPARIPGPDGTDSSGASLSYYNPAQVPTPAAALVAGLASVSYYNPASIPSPDGSSAASSPSVSFYNPATIPSGDGAVVAGLASVSYYNPAQIATSPEAISNVTSVSYHNPPVTTAGGGTLP